MPNSYAEIIAGARANLPALAAANDAQIRKAYELLVGRIITLQTSGAMNSDRAVAISRSIRELLTDYGISIEQVFGNSQLGAAASAAAAHKLALESAAATAGVSVSTSFDDVPRYALEYLVRRRALAASKGLSGHAAYFKAVTARGLQAKAGQIDEILSNAVALGVDSRTVTKEIALAMTGDDYLLKIAVNNLGPKGGLKKVNTIGNTEVFLKSDLYKKADSLIRDSRRIAVHEINAAFFEADALAAARNPMVGHGLWTLSGRHRGLPSSPDRCDYYAHGDWFELGEGVFPPENIPPLPHPFCLCTISWVLRPPADWNKPRPKATPAFAKKKNPTLYKPDGTKVSWLSKFAEAWSTKYTGAGPLSKRSKTEMVAAKNSVLASTEFPLAGPGKPLDLKTIDDDGYKAAGILASKIDDDPVVTPKKTLAATTETKITFDDEEAILLDELYDVLYDPTGYELALEDLETFAAQKGVSLDELTSAYWPVPGTQAAYAKRIAYIKKKIADDAAKKATGGIILTGDEKEELVDLMFDAAYPDSNTAEATQIASAKAIAAMAEAKGGSVFDLVIANGSSAKTAQKVADAVLELTKKKTVVPKEVDPGVTMALSGIGKGSKLDDEIHLAYLEKKATEAGVSLEDFVKANSPDAAFDLETIAMLKKAERVASVEPPPTPPPKVAAAAAESSATVQPSPGFPTGIDDLEYVGELGGSTGAKRYRDPKTGLEYVLKRGASPDHLREEAWADGIYRAAGVRVPEFRLYETPDGPVKLSRFLGDAVTLENYIKSGGKYPNAARKQLRAHFVLDALLGNWDVIGLDSDNILLTFDGLRPRVWRADNGGSLRFRAMGARKTAAQWTGEVTELDSLRGDLANPGAKWAFGADGRNKGVTDDMIAKQIVGVLRKEQAILTAAPPELRPILKERMNYLRNWLEVRAPKPTPKAKPRVESVGLWDAGHAADVERSGIAGVARFADEGDFEDGQILISTRKNALGNDETVFWAKQRQSGYDRLAANFDIAPAAPRVTGPTPLETATAKVENAKAAIFSGYKSTAYHLADGNFSAAKTDAMEKAKETLLQMTKDGEITPSEAGYWMKAAQDALDTQAAYGTPAANPLPMLDPNRAITVNAAKFPDPNAPKKEAKPKPGEKLKARSKHGWYGEGHNFVDGKARSTGQKIGGEVEYTLGMLDYYEADVDGVKIRFANVDKGKNVYALRGVVEIVADGKPTAETLGRIERVLSRLGYNTAAASDEYLEALYIFRHIDKRSDLFSVTTLREAGKVLSSGISDDKKRDKIAAIWNAAASGSTPKVPESEELRALAKGRRRANGNGYVDFDRFDVTPETTKPLEGKFYIHGSSKKTDYLLDRWIAMGGEVTSTLDRVRKGDIRIDGTSPGTDLNNGPAAYFYTSLGSKIRANSYGTVRIRMRAEAGAKRLDAMSFRDDYLDRTYQVHKPEVRTKRAPTPDRAAEFNSNANETLFKAGLSLEDVYQFVAETPTEQASIIAKLKKYWGTDRHPVDGRPFEEVVILLADLRAGKWT